MTSGHYVLNGHGRVIVEHALNQPSFLGVASDDDEMCTLESDFPCNFPVTRLDDFPAELATHRYRTLETATQPMLSIIGSATQEDVEAAAIVDLIFSGRAPAACPPEGASNFTCPASLITQTQYNAALIPHMVTDSGSPARWLGLDTSKTIGELRPYIVNALRLLRVLSVYPFPSPLPLFPFAWPNMNRGMLQKLVLDPDRVELPDKYIEMAITAVVLQTYENTSAWIIEWAGDEAKKKRDRLIVKMILQTVVLAAITWGVGVAVAPLLPVAWGVQAANVTSTVSTAINLVVSEQDRRAIAEDLATVSALFAESDPAFAALVQEMAEVWDYLGAQVGDVDLDDDGLSDDVSDGVSTETLLVGGGIATAAIVAALALGEL